MFNDNVGVLLALLVRTPTSGKLLSQSGLVRADGTPDNVNVFGFQSDQLYNDGGETNINSKAQVGKGTTPATRQDRDIEVPFTNGGAEDNKILVQPANYNSGLAKTEIPTLITPTTGAGAITEEVLMAHLEAQGLDFDFCFSRNVINPPVNFIVGESINIINEVLT